MTTTRITCDPEQAAAVGDIPPYSSTEWHHALILWRNGTKAPFGTGVPATLRAVRMKAIDKGMPAQHIIYLLCMLKANLSDSSQTYVASNHSLPTVTQILSWCRLKVAGHSWLYRLTFTRNYTADSIIITKVVTYIVALPLKSWSWKGPFHPKSFSMVLP